MASLYNFPCNLYNNPCLFLWTNRYIAPEQVPVQYGGLSREGEQEFTVADAVTEVTIKPSTKHTVEFPITEVREEHLDLIH